MNLFRMIVALLALTLAAPALAADVTFSGLVTYRERMALPADAALSVTLVSLPDQRPVTSARAGLGGKASSPIAFSLRVRSTVVASGGQLGLVAEISSGGHVIFRSTQPVVVDVAEPEGNVIEVAPAPLPPPVQPGQVPPAEAPSPLIGVVWTVTSIGGDPVLAQTRLTFAIAPDHRAGGNGGCNSYFAEASLDASLLTLGPIAGTRMACDPVVMAQEDRFFAALGATTGYALAGDALQLTDAAGIPLVGLIRTPEPSQPGG